MIEMRWKIEQPTGEEGSAGCSWVRGEHSGLFCKLQYRHQDREMSFDGTGYSYGWSEWQDVAPPSVMA